MRTAFIQTLCEVAAADPRVWLVTGDLGYSVLERFAAAFPDRYLNAGVAEQNMTGVAAGLALAGKIVFTYSIANFPTFRCLEQVRNDICYHNLNVKIVAVGGGLSYGSAGYTHHGVEDFAILGALPNMTVVAPGDPIETRLAVHELASSPGPAYLRLGKAGDPDVHSFEPPFALGKMIRLRTGAAATVVATGSMLSTCAIAADRLAMAGLNVTLLSCPTVVPFDDDALIESVRTTRRLVTVEEHGVGGLGSLAGEALARAGISAAFRPLRLPREAIAVAGSQAALRAARGLSVDGVMAAVVEGQG
ncbi:MAG: transketolase C-terminal domain-containing protein [Gemmataceae bacterium]